MGLSLYEINEKLRILEEWQVNPDTGEVLSDEEFNKLFDAVQMDLQSKIENTICFAKSLEAEAEAIKAEEKKLADRRKAKENLSERLKKRINDYITWQFTDEDGNVDMAGLNKFRFDSPKAYISYRKSEKVNVLDAEKLPSEFVTVKTETKPNLTEIKKAIKNGTDFSGVAELTTNLNMQIKQEKNMKKCIDFILKWFLKLWRLAFYICGMVALTCQAIGIAPDDLGLIIFLDCMVIIMIPRICDEAFKPLLEKDNEES